MLVCFFVDQALFKLELKEIVTQIVLQTFMLVLDCKMKMNFPSFYTFMCMFLNIFCMKRKSVKSFSVSVCLIVRWKVYPTKECSLSWRFSLHQLYFNGGQRRIVAYSILLGALLMDEHKTFRLNSFLSDMVCKVIR